MVVTLLLVVDPVIGVVSRVCRDDGATVLGVVAGVVWVGAVVAGGLVVGGDVVTGMVLGTVLQATMHVVVGLSGEAPARFPEPIITETNRPSVVASRAS